MSGEPTSFETTKPGEARILLQSAIPMKAKMQVWSQGQRFVLKTRIDSITESDPYIYLMAPREPLVQGFERDLRGAGIERVMCSVHLPTDIVYFEAEVKNGSPPGLHLKVGNPVFKLQRRRSLRVPFSGPDAPIATIRILSTDDVPMVVPVMNASEGGIAIMLQEEAEFKRFPVKQLIHEVRVNIAGVQIQCAADVRHTQEIPSSPRLKKHYKVGLRLNGIPQESMERLARFVFETSARFMGRI